MYDPPLVGELHDIDMDVCACNGKVSRTADMTARMATLIFTEHPFDLSSLPELLYCKV